MADKFTRLTIADGDVFFGDSNTDNDSIEELEDNVDAKLMTFIGKDSTKGLINTSTAETVVGQVSVAANSVNTYLFITAQLRFSTSSAHNCQFRVRVGTAGTTSDGEVTTDAYIIGGANGTFGGNTVVVAIETTHFDKTQLNYVSVTATNSDSSLSTEGACYNLVVLGI